MKYVEIPQKCPECGNGLPCRVEAECRRREQDERARRRRQDRKACAGGAEWRAMTAVSLRASRSRARRRDANSDAGVAFTLPSPSIWATLPA